MPVVGVGLLYQQGYFRQVIDKDGAQQALYPYNDPGQLPITPLRHANGEWLRLEIALTLPTFLLISVSPANYMAAGRSCVSSKNCFSGLAAGGCSGHWAFGRKSVT